MFPQVVGIEEACFSGFLEKIFLSNIPNLEGVKFNPVQKLFERTFHLFVNKEGVKSSLGINFLKFSHLSVNKGAVM